MHAPTCMGQALGSGAAAAAVGGRRRRRPAAPDSCVLVWPPTHTSTRPRPHLRSPSDTLSSPASGQSLAMPFGTDSSPMFPAASPSGRSLLDRHRAGPTESVTKVRWGWVLGWVGAGRCVHTAASRPAVWVHAPCRPRFRCAPPRTHTRCPLPDPVHRCRRWAAPPFLQRPWSLRARSAPLCCAPPASAAPPRRLPRRRARAAPRARASATTTSSRMPRPSSLPRCGGSGLHCWQRCGALQAGSTAEQAHQGAHRCTHPLPQIGAGYKSPPKVQQREVRPEGGGGLPCCCWAALSAQLAGAGHGLAPLSAAARVLR